MAVEEFREFMIELAKASGEFIRPCFRDPSVVVEWKEDASAVTEADRGGERLIREMIADRYPDHGYLLVAGGWPDIMCDPIMNPWDIAALVPIIRGAGGVITDWTGADPVRASSTLAATPALHGQVLALLNS